jgi:hypothetical protein
VIKAKGPGLIILAPIIDKMVKERLPKHYDAPSFQETAFHLVGSMNISPCSGKFPLCSCNIPSTDAITAWRLVSVSPGRIFHTKSEPIAFLIISSNCSHVQSHIFSVKMWLLLFPIGCYFSPE